jgi:hypothetical protein
MSDAFTKFRARIADLQSQLNRGTARPTTSPRPISFKTARPPQVAAHPEASPEKPADAAAPASPLPATAALFSIPSTEGAADSVTLSQKRLRAEAKRDVRLNGARPPPPAVERPKTRGDCFGGPRPCPHVGCRYHTYLEVTAAGSLVINRPDVDVADLKASCSLDVADAGPQTLEAVGAVLNVTRERTRQLESAAIVNAERAFVADEVRAFRGSCKAVCAMSGRKCQLPAHNQNVKHHDGRKAFHLVALPDQVHFPEKERLERVATANVGEAVHERG